MGARGWRHTGRTGDGCARTDHRSLTDQRVAVFDLYIRTHRTGSNTRRPHPHSHTCLSRRLSPTSGQSLCRSHAHCFCHSRAVLTIAHALTLSLSRCTEYSVPHRLTRMLASRTAAQMTTKVSSAGWDDRHHPGAICTRQMKTKTCDVCISTEPHVQLQGCCNTPFTTKVLSILCCVVCVCCDGCSGACSTCCCLCLVMLFALRVLFLWPV